MMGFWEILISLLNILAWPVAIIIVIILLREPIKRLINEIDEFKFGDKSILRHKNQTDVSPTNEELVIKEKDEIAISETLSKFNKSSLEYLEKTIKTVTNFDNIDSDGKINNLIVYSKFALLYILFNNIYKLIYGSQLKILEHLKNYGPSAFNNFRGFYNEAAKAWPDVYKEYSFESYMQFLVANNLLIIKNDGNVALTEWGSDFLIFLLENNFTHEIAY